VEDSDRSKITLSPELAQCIQTMHFVLNQHVCLIHGILAVLIGHESAHAIREEKVQIDKLVAFAIVPVLQAIGSSSNTLVLLSDAPGMQTRDCYSIVRSIVEACINVCYIIAEGPCVAEQALRHARQKAFRDMQRQSRIGETIIQLVCSAIPDPGTIEGLKADLEEFTSKTGREKGWTDLSVDDRIAVAGKRLGGSILTSLHFARFAVYRHSSEILHGSLFGALHFLGATYPPRSHELLEELTDGIGQQHMMILCAANLGISAVVEALHRAYGFSRAYEESRKLFEKLGEIPYLQGNATS